MTPPTARKRPAATHSTRTEVAERDPHRFIGADRLVQQPGERVLPGGVAHVVDGWLPVCGEPRVRFVFPGATIEDATEVCPACTKGALRRVPRQRGASGA